MEGLIEKLTKKYSNETSNLNQHEISNNNLANLKKLKVFNKLLNEYENDDMETKNNIPLSTIEKNLNTEFDFSNQNNKIQIEEQLPHFGGSQKKDNINLNPNDKNYNINNFHNDSFEELAMAQENQTMNTLNKNTMPNNPNNSMKNESYMGVDEDSILGEVYTNNTGNNLSTVNNKLILKFEANQQLDNLMKSNLNNSNNLFSMINTINTNQDNPDQSSFFQNSQSNLMLNENSLIDEYVDDDDPGFDLFECEMEFFKDTCKKLSEQYDFPRRAIIKSKFKNYDIKLANPNELINSEMKSIKPMDLDMINNRKTGNENKLYEVENNSKNNLTNLNQKNSKSLLPAKVKFLESGNNYYPLQYNNVIYDCFNLKVIIDRERTGFEESKEFKIIVNSLIAGRYQVIQYLGSAAFSKAIKCLDIVENRLVCLKIIENNKDYIDQSIDEIKLLRYINANGNSEEKNFLRLYDYFYHKEHLFIVTELLKDNLYNFYKYINENHINYFTMKNLQRIATQILTCLEFVHSLKLIHSDLKPENILIKSISDVNVKVIDFGSSCFIHDHLSSYVQSRSYRAPEVILGCKYDYKVDIWSLGCILTELYTGSVLFQNESIQSLLARIMGIVGPFPDWMLERGKLVNDYFTKERLIFMEVQESVNHSQDNVFTNLSKSHSSQKQKIKKWHILIPKKTQLRMRLRTNDDNFFDFIKSLLEIDPNLRLNASEALAHPWINQSKYE